MLSPIRMASKCGYRSDRLIPSIPDSSGFVDRSILRSHRVRTTYVFKWSSQMDPKLRLLTGQSLHMTSIAQHSVKAAI